MDTTSQIPESQVPGSDLPNDRPIGDLPPVEEQPSAEDLAADAELHVDRGRSHDHYGQDAGRDTLTVGEAQRRWRHSVEQRMPAMSQNNAADADKLAGILAQTRADLPGASVERLTALLLERASQAGVPLSAHDAQHFAEQLNAP